LLYHLSYAPKGIGGRNLDPIEGEVIGGLLFVGVVDKPTKWG